MAYENTVSEISGTQVAVAGFATLLTVSVINGIINALSARQQADSFEARMLAWRNPELKFADENREFRLSKLERAEKYLFTDLPAQITELRQYESVLALEKANPQALFQWYVEQLCRANDIILNFDDEKKANSLIAEFKEIHFTGCHVFAQPEPTPDNLLTDIQPTLDFMRRQFDEVQKAARGRVHGGDWGLESNSRDQELEAMESEIVKEKLTLEALESALESKCQLHIKELETLKNGMGGIAKFYDLAALLIMPPEDFGDEDYRQALGSFKEAFAVMMDETHDECSRLLDTAALMLK